MQLDLGLAMSAIMKVVYSSIAEQIWTLWLFYSKIAIDWEIAWTVGQKSFSREQQDCGTFPQELIFSEIVMKRKGEEIHCLFAFLRY